MLFAIIGVVSAGTFFADRISAHSTVASSNKSGSTHPSTSSNPALRDIARAQAQATAIVLTAQRAGHQIVVASTRRANRRVAAIVGAAKSRSQPAPAPAPAPAPVQVSPQYSAGATSNGYGSVAPVQATTPIPTYAANTARSPASTTSGSASAPDLTGVPASWLVVGYNAVLGSGPGTAGSISVINRSQKPFSGVAEVVYGNGRIASAPFAGLAPGQSEVLPLNGPAYTGGGYRIVMVGVH